MFGMFNWWECHECMDSLTNEEVRIIAEEVRTNEEVRIIAEEVRTNEEVRIIAGIDMQLASRSDQ